MQIAVVVAEVSKAASSFVEGRPLRQGDADPPLCRTTGAKMLVNPETRLCRQFEKLPLGHAAVSRASGQFGETGSHDGLTRNLFGAAGESHIFEVS